MPATTRNSRALPILTENRCKRGPERLHYDGSRPNVTTWEELQDWRYDIEERQLRLDAREQELRARDAEGRATREEIGAFLAAAKVLHKEYLAMHRIQLATMQSALFKFRSKEETMGEVAQREGWPSDTPPLVFPPPDWHPYPDDDDDSNEDE